MKHKEFAKKILEDLWWIFKRDSWIIGIMSILFGKYADSIPADNLIKFLVGQCFQYIVLIPMPILAVIILSHVCTLGQKKLNSNTSRRPVQVLYIAGTVVVLFAHVITIHVFSIMLFYKPYNTPLNATQNFWLQAEFAYSLVFTPIFDWYIFRKVIPKKFSNENKDMKEIWYCDILNIPRKNMIPTTLGFFMLVVLLEILC